MFILSIIILFIFVSKTKNEVVEGAEGGKPGPNLEDDVPHPTIIGGYQATIDEFPYAVRLYIRDINSLSYCSGQAIHEVLALTAAHCVAKRANIVIVAGEADQKDYVEGKNIDKYARYRVIDKFIHPGFDKKVFVHDVALVKTARPMVHKNHGIVKIAFKPLEEHPVDAKIFGWGKTEMDGSNNALYAKALKVRGCKKGSIHYEARYVCLMERGIDHGDSGGGVIIGGEVYGIASFYDPAATDFSERYFFTALSEEKDFLTDSIKKNGSNYNRCFLYLNWVFLFYLYVLR